jgi:hypothetical protein
MPNSPQGSLWRKWDLHVHTPLSINQGYGGDTKEAWDKFFQDIESLPPEIKVIGINDYIFIDGYERVLKAKKLGRLKNIDLILPVIELRLDIFSGTTSDFKRLNYHVIFSNEVPPDVIRHQFIGALLAEYKLSPEYDLIGNRWNGVVTDIQALQELGEWLKNNTPESKRKSLPSPLNLGFSNLNYPLEEIKKRLKHHNFSGKYLTALGKAEWSKFRWDGGGSATKRDLINSVDFVFTAAKTVEDAQKSIEVLRLEKVNERLLDCSDSHYFSNSSEHMRLGHCCSWIKADTTFEGLKLASRNYEGRVYIGHEPEKVLLVRSNRTKYVNSLRVAKTEKSTLLENWFRADLVFSHDLVVVIGNKGNAKSALTDIIALCGNTRIKEFSFLNRNRFCDRNNKAEHFEAEIFWESGVRKLVCLSDAVDTDEAESVKYVPQSFFEKVTNEVAANIGGDFDRELRKVIFSHIPEPDRLGFEDLNSLLKHHSTLLDNSLKQLRNNLSNLNSEITDIEEDLSREEIQKLTAEINSKCQVIESHEANNPEIVEQPSIQSEQAQKLDKYRNLVVSLSEEVNQKNALLSLSKKQRSTIEQTIGKLNQKLEEIRYEKDLLTQELNRSGISISLEEVFKVIFNASELEKNQKSIEVKIEDLERCLNPDIQDSLLVHLNQSKDQVNQLQEELNSADKAYQSYLASQQEWELTKQRLIGTADDVGSLKFLEEKLRRRQDDYPSRLNQLKEQRRDLIRNIYSRLAELSQIYRDLASSVQLSMDKHNLTQEKYGLDFKVRLTFSDFSERFLDFINQGRAGSFNGKEDGKIKLQELCCQYDFSTPEETIEFTDCVLNMLNNDCRYDPPREVNLKNQLRNSTVIELYDFLFSLKWLEPEYSLQLDGKEMKQLSPGERGVLLLIFYLLIDKDDCPLLIDQPEENLDNQSIYNLLVPAVSEAKKRRQIFLVTHNPNLAIVCDADQIIHSSIDKNDGNRVIYQSGAIENPIFNKHALDILEGTKPAFDIRKETYLSLLK